MEFYYILNILIYKQRLYQPLITWEDERVNIWDNVVIVFCPSRTLHFITP